MYNDHITGIGTLISVECYSEIDHIEHFKLGESTPFQRVPVRSTLVVTRIFEEYDGKNPRCYDLPKSIPGLGALICEEYSYNVNTGEGKCIREFREVLPLEIDSYTRLVPPMEAIQQFINMSHSKPVVKQMTKDMSSRPDCPDCNGSGIYEGLKSVENCKRCNGAG